MVRLRISLLSLAQAAAESGGGYIAHMRSEPMPRPDAWCAVRAGTVACPAQHRGSESAIRENHLTFL